MEQKKVRRKVGNMEQLASVRRMQYQDGLAGGLQGIEVKSGPLRYVIAIDKCLDIVEASYQGININFLSKPGLQNRQHYDSNGFQAQRSIMGGLFFTCGTDNVGTPDLEIPLPMHGTLRQTPATHICSEAFWEGDKYTLRVSGEIRQAALFEENIVLKRTIETVFGEDTIKIHDEYRNDGFKKAPFMILYHWNLGHPFLDEGCEIRIPSQKAVLRGEENETKLPWGQIEPPTDNLAEQVFFHEVLPNEKGLVTVGMYNPALDMTAQIEYCKEQLPLFTQWKSMASGDYVVGLEPCNCHVNGRKWEEENQSLKYINPGEIKEVSLNFKLIKGE